MTPRSVMRSNLFIELLAGANERRHGGS